eukprot:sb/3460865/
MFGEIYIMCSSGAVMCLSDIVVDLYKNKAGERISEEYIKEIVREKDAAKELVDLSVEEATKILTTSFLSRYGRIDRDEEGLFFVRDGVFPKITKKEPDEEVEDLGTPPIEDFFAHHIPFEPTCVQFLHFAAAKAPPGGFSKSSANTYFGLEDLITRVILRMMMPNQITTGGYSDKNKTLEQLYVLVSDGYGDVQEEKVDSKQKHLVITSRRKEAISDIITSKGAATRSEIRQILREQGETRELSQIDGKTLNRIFGSLVKDGIVKMINVKVSGKELAIYHSPDASKEIIDMKLEVIRETVSRSKCGANYVIEGLVTMFVSNLLKFPDPIPESLFSEDSFTSDLVYKNPRARFLQEIHFVVSVIIRRWPVDEECLPEFLLVYLNWWQYMVEKAPPVPIQANGMYEVYDVMQFMPLKLVFHYNYRHTTFEKMRTLLGDPAYAHRFCFGQLPRDYIKDLHDRQLHLLNSTAKSFDYALNLPGIIEVPGFGFDINGKMVTNLKFRMRDRILVLDTSNAPVRKDVNRGYNIRKIRKPQVILSLPNLTYQDFIGYWNKVEEICRSLSFSELASFKAQISDPLRGLGEVLFQHDIKMEQPPEYYNNKGMKERLGEIYSELGPAGFNLRFFFHRVDSWEIGRKNPNKFGHKPLQAALSMNRNVNTNCPYSRRRSKDAPMSSDEQYTTLCRKRNFRKKSAVEKPKPSKETKAKAKPVTEEKTEVGEAAAANKDDVTKQDAAVNSDAEKDKPVKRKRKRPSKAKPKPLPVPTVMLSGSEGSDWEMEGELPKKEKIKIAAKRQPKKRQSFGAIKLPPTKKSKQEEDSYSTKSRAKFSEEEDEILILWMTCCTIFDKPIEGPVMRNLLHKHIPHLATDKTVHSVMGHHHRVLNKAHVTNRIVDLKSNARAFMDRCPELCKTMEDLFDQRAEWATSYLQVRTVLPQKVSEFKANNQVVNLALDGRTHITLFCDPKNRAKRPQFLDIPVKDIWSDPTVSERQKQIYSKIILSLLTDTTDHNEASFKMLTSYDQNELSHVYDYMKKNRMLRRNKAAAPLSAKSGKQKPFGFTYETQCSFFEPYNHDLLRVGDLARPPEDPVDEIYYSTLTPRAVYDFFENLLSGCSKVIVSGSISPFIENKSFVEAFQNEETEDELYTSLHTKRNTFFSGIATLEEGRGYGFQLSEKHIGGRMNYKVYQPPESERMVDGYEELLGLKQSQWPVPLKIFSTRDTTNSSSFWSRVDLETGVLGKRKQDNEIKGGVCELKRLDVSEACEANIVKGEPKENIVKLFEQACKNLGKFHLVAPGKRLLETIFASTTKGRTLEELMMVGSPDRNITLEALQLCLDIEIVLKAGVTSIKYVSKKYGKHYLITMADDSVSMRGGCRRGRSQSISEKDESTASTSSAKTADNPSDRVMESDFKKFFPLATKPWRSANSDISMSGLGSFLRSIILSIFHYPGITKALIDNRYHASLSPAQSTELLESLMQGNNSRLYFCTHTKSNDRHFKLSGLKYI